MVPFEDFSFTKLRDGVLRISFDYAYPVPGYDHAFVFLIEQDGSKDQWELRPRTYIPRSGISSTRLALYNVTYNDWWTYPTNTSGDRDDTARRRFLKPLALPLGATQVDINAYYNPSQPDRGSTLEFYAIVAIVAEANGHAVSLLGDYYITPTLTGV